VPIPLRIDRGLQDDVVRVLRGEAPRARHGDEAIEAALRRYECGGWLHGRSRSEGAPLPGEWAPVAAAAHRRTLAESLAALRRLREVGALLREHRMDAILMKGAAYLAALYPDPGMRPLTDVDLLLREESARRLGQLLAARGFRGRVGPAFPEDERFEMYRADRELSPRVEIHWRLGVAGRTRIDQEGIWRAARPMEMEGERFLLLSAEDAILYHAWHASDHYFGHSLKWVLDLREMLRRFAPDPPALLERARRFRVSVPLHLALVQLEGLLPGSVPAALLSGTRPGTARRIALRPFRGHGALEFLRLGSSDRARVFLRPLLIDSPVDALAAAWRVVSRHSPQSPDKRLAVEPLPWEGAA
jgi:Uncharacterised nucleotidyltransferase